MESPAVILKVLGTLSLHTGDGTLLPNAPTQPRRLAVLLYLALAEPRGRHTRESLMAMLWPDADDESARHSLRNTLYELRRVLGERAILSHGESYIELNSEIVACDATQLREQLRQRAWREAVARYTGDVAPGFHVAGSAEFDQWLETQRASLRTATISAAWAEVNRLAEHDSPGLLEAMWIAWQFDRSDEAGARRLMQLELARRGGGGALGVYDELTEYLHRELGTSPGAETAALAAEIRKQHPRKSLPDIQAITEDAAVPISDAAAISSWRHRPRFLWVGAALAASVLLIAAGRGWIGSGSTSLPALPTAPLAERYRTDTSAYASYLRGMVLRFDDQTRASRDTFDDLTRRKPTYAPAFAGLAHSYAQAAFLYLPPQDAYPLAEHAARRALAIDSTVAAAWTALGMVEIWKRNIPEAGRLIEHGVALAPDDPESHVLRGIWMRWRGLPDSSLAELRLALELDQFHPYLRNIMARQLVWMRRYREAETILQQTLRAYPEQPASYNSLSLIYRIENRPIDAAKMLLQAQRLEDSTSREEPSIATAEEAQRYLDANSRARLQRIQRRQQAGEHVSAAAFLYVYAELRDTTNLLMWLDSMEIRREPSAANFLLNPLLDFARNDPRYLAWRGRLAWVDQ